MAESDRIMAALLAAADAAELLPYVPDEPSISPAHACNHHHRVGGLFFTIACGGIAGQTLPPVDQVWLALSAFDHLTTNVPGNQSKIDPKSVLATVLRRRMRFLELLVRVSMTRECDWQTSLYHRPVATKTATAAADIPQQPDYQQLQQQQQQFNWRHVLHKLTGDTWSSASTHRALSTLRWSHPRFLIQWEHDPIPENFPDMLETFLMGVSYSQDDETKTKTKETKEEWRADETLRELLADSPAATPSHRIVELGVSLCDGRVTTSLLFNIIEVLERFGRAQQLQQQQQQKNTHKTRIEFRVTSLMFTGLCVMAGNAIENLGELLRNSRYLHLQELRLTQLSDVEDHCLQRCLADLTSPPPPATKRTTTRRKAAGLKRLMIEHDAKPSFAVLSAAVRCCDAASSLQEITVAYSAVDMRSVAAWLAFAFFHADSNSQVHTLRLRMAGSDEFNARVPPYATCSPQFVATFTHVLRRVVASEELAPLDAKTMKSAAALKRKRDAGTSTTSTSLLEEIPLPDNKRVFVELKRSTKARIQPRSNSPVIATLASPMMMADDSDSDSGEDDSDEQLQQPPQQYQVIRRLHGWLAVVVPGFGAGWIPQSVVVKELLRETLVPLYLSSGEAAAPLPAPVTNRRITSFSWIGGTLPADDVLKEEHADALMELLAVMGNPLRMLQLPCMWLHNQHVAPILTHCPQLQELNLYGNRITDLAPLVAAYETGACRISALSVGQHSEIHDVVVRQCGAILKMCNQQPNPHSTTSIISNEKRPIQRPTLQRLVLRLTPFDYFRLGHYLSDVIPAIDQAIAQDPKLEYVRILCDMQDYGNLRIEIERLQAQRMLAARTATATPTTETEGEAPGAGAGAGAVAPPAATEDGMRSRPLPLACKLAMVSVVHHASTQHSALSGMDAGVLAVVFGLARTCQPRVVDFFADQIML